MTMALSRLRHHFIARFPSIFMAHIPFSFPPLAYTSSSIRTSCTICSLGSGGHLLLRSVFFCSIIGVHRSLSLKVGGRQFSSEDSSHMVIGMPALSPTMTQGNITKWRKKEGDKIDIGDVLCEIETDKATLEFECLEEGFLAKILVPEGTKDVTVGKAIAITVEDANDIQNIATSYADISELKSEESAHDNSNHDITAPKGGSMKRSSDLPPHIVLEMPALSPTMNQGNITTWRRKEGDKIDVGDVICEIETDKATLEYESLEEGYLAKILAPAGSKDVAVGCPIAVTVEVAEDVEAIRASSFTASEGKEDTATPHKNIDKSTMQDHLFSRISPAARLLVAKSRLDASLLKASGPHGILLKGDVLDAVKLGSRVLAMPSSLETTPSPRVSQKTSPATRDQMRSQIASDSFEDLPNSQIRKVIARRLLESKQTAPHLYLSSDVILDPLLKFRGDLQEQHGIKVSVNDIIIKVVAVALRNVPEANGYWDDGKGEIVSCDAVDISVAVATEKGLMTPIVRNADQKTISSISAEVKSLAEKARAGKLAPHEFQGGTFSISNLGMFPVDHFCAIINPPQACILAVGRGNKVVELVIGNDGAERPAVVTKMKLTLSADHRVFDGKVAGALMSSLKLNFGDIQRLHL